MSNEKAENERAKKKATPLTVRLAAEFGEDLEEVWTSAGWW